MWRRGVKRQRHVIAVNYLEYTGRFELWNDTIMPQKLPIGQRSMWLHSKNGRLQLLQLKII